jgi:hypothetical protein
MKARSLFRVLRWVGLGAAVPALWACTSRSLEAPVVKPEQTFTKTFQQTVNRNVDLLFLIDDSSSMRLSQMNLERNFPQFMTALQGIPGGLPNVHIGVISSDMGAGDGSISGCSGSGKGGIFQYTARGSCTATNLQAGATFIKNIDGVANYTGQLQDVFTCIAALGESGCGFEHQFAAITRALGADGSAPPIENQGFLRNDAYLAIILITNEDDCSAAAGVPLFDTSANLNLASQLGPPSNFRCNEFGHICEGGAPSRNAPNGQVTDTMPYQNCVSAEGSGLLKTVGETAAQIKGLKSDPASQIIVAAITGPTTPYQVHWKNPSTSDTGPWPEVTHSCTAQDTSFADPSVRVTEFVQQFGGNGLTLSICDQSFAPALMRIAQEIGRVLEPPCIIGRVANKPGSGVPDCTVVSHTGNGSGMIIDSAVPSCMDTGGTGPCWQLIPGMNCGGGQTMDVTPDPANPMPASQNATVGCALCIPGVADPDRGCP